MAANTTPIFTLTPHISSARISTANTGRDGTGTLGSVITGTTNGTRIHHLQIQATSNTTAGQVRLFIDDGTNIRFWKEIAVTAATVSATVQAFSYSVSLYGEAALVLPNTYILKAGTHNGESFDVIAEGGDF